MKHTLLLLLVSLLVSLSNYTAWGQIPKDTGYFIHDYINKAAKKMDSKDYKGAIKLYTKVIELGADEYLNRGVCKEQLKDYYGAIKDFNKEIELDTTSTAFAPYYNRASAKNKLGDKKGACEDWQKALELGFSEAKAQINKYCK